MIRNDDSNRLNNLNEKYEDMLFCIAVDNLVETEGEYLNCPTSITFM